MKVQLGDREVWIEFVYGFQGAALQPSLQEVEVTSCLLRDGSAPREPKQPAPILAVGNAVRYVNDPPNRELARKAALTKALGMLDQVMPYQDSATLDIEHSNHLLKQRRKLFWDAYLNRKKTAVASKSSGIVFGGMPEYRTGSSDAT
jgi:hypothetical protein